MKPNRCSACRPSGSQSCFWARTPPTATSEASAHRIWLHSALCRGRLGADAKALRISLDSAWGFSIHLKELLLAVNAWKCMVQSANLCTNFPWLSADPTNDRHWSVLNVTGKPFMAGIHLSLGWTPLEITLKPIIDISLAATMHLRVFNRRCAARIRCSIVSIYILCSAKPRKEICMSSTYLIPNLLYSPKMPWMACMNADSALARPNRITVHS